VIATGFNAEQQNDIVNTEAKKIIHTLEDEQKAEQILSTGPSSDTIEFSVSDPIGVSIPNDSEDKIIKHTLFDEEESDTELPFDGFIDTTEKIKNIAVSYEEINIHHVAEFEEVDINDIDVNEFVIVDSDIDDFDDDEEIDDVEINEEFVEVDRNSDKEEQMLMFDMPMSSVSPDSKETEKKQSLESVELKMEATTKNVEDIEVTDPIEVVPITEISGEGVKRYSLDDYQEMEELLNEVKPVADEITDEEIVFEKKTTKAPPKEETNDELPADPINSPISKLLSERTEERKRKMKEFNYKFRNSASQIDEIEKEPAYKRAGIELDETIDTDSKISRTSINIDDDDDIELRSNNSFLHDNVD
jgi:cell division protein FtsZ